ncbi:alpha/beta hydrolase [Vibrio fortis]|uniref:alpha/beta hydrolase n=1 Tax=Vibrio fortis TaxID=212667 RepID=UPI0021C414CD|nr:alpha/beta hydrolase [Vibrio fortis]
MKQYRNLLLALPLIVLAGCNSSSNGTHKAKVNKPVADYKFTEDALKETVSDRMDFFEGIRLTFDGAVYETTEFSEGFGSDEVLAKLVDSNGNKVDVLLSVDNGSCFVLPKNGVLDGFDCRSDKRTVSGEQTLIQSQTQNGKQEVLLEYYTNGIEEIGSIGSTILTAVERDGRVDITTTFAFDDFFRLAGLNSDGSRANSTLGLTTYLQLKEIVKSHIGQEMTVKFDNHIGGSADDDINMYTGLLIHKNNMHTVVTKNGSVFSGGTDLFAAGKTRTLQRAKQLDNFETLEQIGVHSWGSADKTAKDFPYTDESHRKQATYFNTVMGDKGIDFYLFTLDSAPFNGQHWITKADSDKYQFITNIE